MLRKTLPLSLLFHLSLGVSLFFFTTPSTMTPILPFSQDRKPTLTPVLWIKPIEAQSSKTSLLGQNQKKTLTRSDESLLMNSQKENSPLSPSNEEMNYFHNILTQIEKRLYYPQALQLQGAQGRLLLRLKLSKNGELIDATVEKSSGFEDLDELGLSATKNSAPFNSPPPTFFDKKNSMGELILHLPIEFKIRSIDSN